jgi:hypothetical protein
MGRVRFLAVLGALTVLMTIFIQLSNPTGGSQVRVFTEKRPTGPIEQALGIAPGELPGYTGWGRPERTLAGYFAVSNKVQNITTVGEDWLVDLQCRGHPNCKTATSWFYARAYGPAIVSGQIVPMGHGAYRIRFQPMDPGLYTVEVVVTFSNPPSIDSFPLPDGAAPVLYEGYLIAGFPWTLTVTGPMQQSKLPICSIKQLSESSSFSAFGKARWRVVDQVRHRKHSIVTHDDSRVSFAAYQQSYNSLGVNLAYEFNDCRLMGKPSQSANPFLCIQKPLHVILIGDSTMRLQRDILASFVYSQIRITFVELYGGTLRCQKVSGPNVTMILEEAAAVVERRVVLFNTGLHDIHRLCGSEWASDRKTYLKDPNESCSELYKVAVKSLADEVASFPAEVKIFQTTTAAWPKYGNFGVAWDPRYGQGLPLDSGFIEHFNELAVQVLKPYQFHIVDGYWISLARPDHREIDQKSDLGKKLSHPGVEVIVAMVRIWFTLVMQSLCA